MPPPHPGCMVVCVDKLAAKDTFVLNSADGWGGNMFKHGCRPPFPNLVGNYDEDATGIARKKSHTSPRQHTLL